MPFLAFHPLRHKGYSVFFGINSCDRHYTIPPYSDSPLRFVLEFLGRGMVLPSSDIDRSFTRCGLRPRHVNNTLTSIAYIDTDFQEMKPLVSYNVDYFGAQHLHLRYGWQTAFPTALHSLLPHYARGSVQDWWLAFALAGLSSLSISASLGALIRFLLCLYLT